ncbi:hypothetical protein [Pseudomonas gingeri]
MAYTLVRIDFYSGEKCGVCPRPLTSGKARVLVDELGNEVFVGPVCAVREAANGKEKVPDLTMAALDPEAEGGAGGAPRVGAPGAGGNTSSQDTSERDRVRAESYLLLRTEKLATYPGMSYGKLKELQTRYRGAELTEDDIRYLINLMAKVQRERPEYSYRNLQAIYACDFWIERFLINDKSDFISDLKSYLNSKLALTTRQIEGLNKWFKHREGMISIKPDAFAFDPSKR